MVLTRYIQSIRTLLSYRAMVTALKEPITFGSIIVRQATPADYQGVLSMGEMYNGMDYIPHLYNRYIKDPNVGMIVAEEKSGDGRIMAFGYVVSVDDDQALIPGGGRVRPGFEKKGYATAIFGFLNMMRKTQFSSVLREYSRTRDYGIIERMPKVVKTIDKNLVDFSSTFATLDETLPQLLTKSQDETDFIRTTILSKERAREFFSDSQVYPFLFPMGYLSVLHEIYGMYRSNFHRIIKHSDVVLTEEDGTPTVVSFVTLTPLLTKGVRLDIDFYGGDLGILKVHMLKALDFVRSNGNLSGNVQIRVGLFNLPLWKEPLREFGHNVLNWSPGLEDNVTPDPKIYIRDMKL